MCLNLRGIPFVIISLSSSFSVLKQVFFFIFLNQKLSIVMAWYVCLERSIYISNTAAFCCCFYLVCVCVATWSTLRVRDQCCCYCRVLIEKRCWSNTKQQQKKSKNWNKVPQKIMPTTPLAGLPLLLFALSTEHGFCFVMKKNWKILLRKAEKKKILIFQIQSSEIIG